ncbi:conserved hypothetical protein [Talaromyces stipitatus ATCC 10500]|uniref:Zn(2)-C6 fungal-type domain-containing protein n=1 Tax=Talaromyces stipitatus (strain ATCC 10500 / CBS 375.48 / QM 6759 / NRRL 1006) TaxID=441959 RepID=B8MN48_TALSN|nr:uncharacterized protein TSTA_107050 [Talaromyces stipitatus ATCC 10500]EED14497.1 conserved hypothetical protein [Talaromyces stipitatus ATCC 10500]
MSANARGFPQAPEIKIRVQNLQCGEEKPQCVRCSSTGRKCEYSSTIIGTLAPIPHVSNLHKTLSLSPNTGSRERRAFAYYLQHTAVSIGGGLDADFWNITIPQICQSESAVWDAMIAISSLFEVPRAFHHLDSVSRGHSQSLGESQKDALDWYSRSVSAVRRGIERGAIDSFVGLITCMLFICIESLLGNMEEAILLYRQAVHLILTLWAQRSFGTVTGAQILLLKDTIIPIFIRLASSSPKTTWALTMTMARETEYTCALPQEFRSLKAAREAIVMLAAEVTVFEQTCEQYLQKSQAWNISEDMMSQQGFLSARLQSWHTAFTNFLGSQRAKGDLSPFHVSIDALLSSYHEMLLIILGVCKSPLRITTDAYTENFRAIVEKSSIALGDLGREDGVRAPYTFELSVGLPLWFTCIRCRESRIRRAALALLRRTHQVQGLAKRDHGTALVEVIMMLEETSAISVNAAEDGANFTFSQPFNKCINHKSHSQDSGPFDTLEAEVAARSTPQCTHRKTEKGVINFIPQEARVRPHGAFRLGDELPPELTEQDIATSNLQCGQTYLHISRNERDLTNNSWRMVHDFIPLVL